jgi:DNA-binding NarL/FixJ family response regulator
MTYSGGVRTRPLRIVLVDDHEIVRQGLKAMLSRHAAEVRVVGEAADADQAETVVRDLDPDIVVCDVRLKGASGLDLTRRLIAQAPDRPVVLLTVYDDEQYLYQALRVGARGYLSKRVDGPELVHHLQQVANGELAIDPTLAGRVAASAARLQAGDFWAGAHLGLTHRESEVLALLVGGLSNRAIAARLVLGEETVKSHLRGIYRKLEVADRAGAVAAAIREGLFQ